MDKKELQAQELDQVSGGQAFDDVVMYKCPSCEKTNYLYAEYPDGWCVESKGGCNPVFYYKCPDCGYEWHT